MINVTIQQILRYFGETRNKSDIEKKEKYNTDRSANVTEADM